MTLPNGAAGVDQTQWGITGDPAAGDTPAALAARDQATVQNQLKQQQLQSPGWNASNANVFAGQGITGSLGLSGGTVKAMMQKLGGMPLSVTSGGLPNVLDLFRGIPASQIFSGASQNLLLNGQFTLGFINWVGNVNPTTFLPDWVIDPNEGHDLAGSAKIVADGTLKWLYSESIWVQSGDTITLSGWRKFSGGTATGTPIKLVIEALDLFGGLVSSTTIGTATGSGSSGWAQITGEDFTVPSGVVFVRAKIIVDTTMTAGAAWFDDVELTKGGLLQSAAIPNISAGAGPGQSADLADAMARQINILNAQLSALTSVSRNPNYVCRYAIGDVSYPESDNAWIDVYYDADGSSAGAHATPSQWTVSPGDAIGGLVGIKDSVIHDSIAIAGNKSAASLNNVFLDVYRLNSDDSGVLQGMTRLAAVDVASQFSPTTDYIEGMLPSKTGCLAGERYAIVLRNASTVATDVSIVGKTQVGGMQDIGMLFRGADAGKASYTAAEVTAAFGATAIQPWVQIAQKNPIITPRSWSDNFDRNDIGGQWMLKATTTDQLGLLFGKVIYYSPVPSNGNQNGVFLLPTATDAARVQANLSPNLFALTGQRCGILLHAARDFSQVVFLGVNVGSAAIYSGTTTSLTQRASVTGLFGDGLYSLYYDEPNDKYVALLNGQPIGSGLEWDSPGGAVLHGPDFRFGGVRIESTSGTPAGSIDNWTLSDWTP